jgi:predicted RNA binding protein with dsRBD fold (UPF0201 family)
MNKQNFLTLTLIISGLALNPVMAEATLTQVTQTQNINQTVTSGISTLLYNRGLDEEAAEELAQNFVEAEDEMFLAMLMQTLETQNIASREEVMEYLSTAALHRQKIDLKKYDALVGMLSKIRKSTLDKNTLEKLSTLSKINTQLFV